MKTTQSTLNEIRFERRDKNHSVKRKKKITESPADANIFPPKFHFPEFTKFGLLNISFKYCDKMYC